MKVIIGSENKDKIGIVRDALAELHLDVKVVGVKVGGDGGNEKVEKW